MSDFDWPPELGGEFTREFPADVQPQATRELYYGGPLDGPSPLHPMVSCAWAAGGSARRTQLAAGDRCPDCQTEIPLQTVDGWPVNACGTCYAPIVWAVTVDGKRMPVDGPLTDGGNVVLSAAPGGGVAATVLDQDALFGDGPRHVAHFVTCPDADTWRNRRAKS